MNLDYKIKTINNADKLSLVLEFCYNILGQHLREIENYSYKEWEERIYYYPNLMLYAELNDQIISAVLGRAESKDSLIMGFTACDERFRKQGITKNLVSLLENNAKLSGFKYITLGADPHAHGFYEKCGYQVINELHGQKIFQKIL
jgi:predicted N-acetyltransferase YhbS